MRRSHPSWRPRLLDRQQPSDGERPPFVEGLILGAMVGAAIAGSTLWTRLRHQRAHRTSIEEPRHPDRA